MTWQIVRLGELLRHRSEFFEIEPNVIYSRCRVQTSARGVVVRDRVEGSTIKTKRQQACRTGEFLVAEIDAKMGGYGLVPEDLNGAIVSSHYFLYEIDETRLQKQFLEWYSKTPTFFAQISAQGSTNYAAIRPEAILNYGIPLPPLGEQIDIVKRLERISRGVSEIQSVTTDALNDINSLVFSLHEKLSDAKSLKFGDLVELDEIQVTVSERRDFPQLGIRSFGRGLFFKESVSSSETSYKKFNQVYQGALVVSQPKGWEGAVAVASNDQEGWFVSPEYRTFRCNEKLLDPSYLAALIMTPWFQKALSKMTKGQGARRERLRPEMLTQFELRMPSIDAQKAALNIIKNSQLAATNLSTRSRDAQALLPAMLYDIFERNTVAPTEATKPNGNAISLPQSQPLSIDTPFKEAVLVGAIINVFHEEGGQPLGNFRLQKAVYFARRFMGESALDQQYLRKAAGPYNPSMRYSGGVKFAIEKNWIAPATGKFGPGHSPSSAFDDARAWIEQYQFAQPAAWVRDKFKFKQNDIWELLATVDYAMLALKRAGSALTATNVLAYISDDEEWHPKVERLRLSEASIQNAMVELQSLFSGFGH